MRVPKAALSVAIILGVGACGGGDDRAEIGSAATTTSVLPSTTTLVPTTTLPPTTADSSPVTTVRRTTTTRRPASTTTTSTTSTGRPPPCSAAQLVVVVTTDKATYRPGETVMALATLRNRSGAPCATGSYNASHRFTGPSGRQVGTAGVLHADSFPGAVSLFGPGDSLNLEPTFDQKTCEGPRCVQEPPGIYTVSASWSFGGPPPIEGSATFRLVAA